MASVNRCQSWALGVRQAQKLKKCTADERKNQTDAHTRVCPKGHMKDPAKIGQTGFERVTSG